MSTSTAKLCYTCKQVLPPVVKEKSVQTASLTDMMPPEILLLIVEHTPMEDKWRICSANKALYNWSKNVQYKETDLTIRQASLAAYGRRQLWPDKGDSDAFIDAAEGGHLNIIKFMVTLPLMNTLLMENALCFAVLQQHVDIAEFLISFPDVDWEDDDFLTTAVDNNDWDMVKLFATLPPRDHEANRSTKYWAIGKSMEEGKFNIADLLARTIFDQTESWEGLGEWE
jgi:hypothetical protein